MKSALNWFEIPTHDIARAGRFYEAVLGVTLKHEDFFGTKMAVFPAEDPGVGGGLIQDDKRPPAEKGGAIIYLDASSGLDAAIERAARSGGAVVMPKTSIGPQGHIALVRDTEGNTIGLHSP
jgi:hypothetical protein